MSSLLDRALAKVDTWVPEEGDVLEGVVEGTFTVESDYEDTPGVARRVPAVEVNQIAHCTIKGQPYTKAYDKDDLPQALQFIGYATVAASQLHKAGLQRGDRVAIVRQPDKANRNDKLNPIKMYRIVVERPLDVGGSGQPQSTDTGEQVPF